MRVIGLMVLTLLLVPGSSLADESGGYPYLGRVTGDDVRLRTGPSLNHRVIDLAPKGEMLVVEEAASSAWLKVRVPGGAPCWIREDLLTVRGDEAIVAKSNVVMRPTAGRDYLPLEGRLQPDEKLRVLETSRPAGEELAWIRVLAPERIPVFISARFVARAGPVPDDLGPLAVKRAARLRSDARSGTRADTAARRDDGLRARVRKVQASLDERAKAPDPVPGLDALKRELQSVLTEAEFSVTKLEAASAFKDILLLEKRQELARARSEAALTEEQLRAAIRKADETYRAAVGNLSRLAPLRQLGFTSVGWVQLRRGAWVIEKGGVPLYVLTSRLFQIRDFARKKVGVRGPLIGEDPERGVRIIDVETIEIFSD